MGKGGAGGRGGEDRGCNVGYIVQRPPARPQGRGGLGIGSKLRSARGTESSRHQFAREPDLLERRFFPVGKNLKKKKVGHETERPFKKVRLGLQREKEVPVLVKKK